MGEIVWIVLAAIGCGIAYRLGLVRGRCQGRASQRKVWGERVRESYIAGYVEGDRLKNEPVKKQAESIT